MLTSGGESSVQGILNKKMAAISITEKRGWTSTNKAYTSVRKLIFNWRDISALNKYRKVEYFTLSGAF